MDCADRWFMNRRLLFDSVACERHYNVMTKKKKPIEIYTKLYEIKTGNKE